jgi:hypothetical protein
MPVYVPLITAGNNIECMQPNNLCKILVFVQPAQVSTASGRWKNDAGYRSHPKTSMVRGLAVAGLKVIVFSC